MLVGQWFARRRPHDSADFFGGTTAEAGAVACNTQEGPDSQDGLSHVATQQRRQSPRSNARLRWSSNCWSRLRRRLPALPAAAAAVHAAPTQVAASAAVVPDLCRSECRTLRNNPGGRKGLNGGVWAGQAAERQASRVRSATVAGSSSATGTMRWQLVNDREQPCARHQFIQPQ